MDRSTLILKMAPEWEATFIDRPPATIQRIRFKLLLFTSDRGDYIDVLHTTSTALSRLSNEDAPRIFREWLMNRLAQRLATDPITLLHRKAAVSQAMLDEHQPRPTSNALPTREGT